MNGFVFQGLRNDFVRNIMWTFEDIHMLVGSNMPIFGGGRYPAVSLRLRFEILFGFALSQILDIFRRIITMVYSVFF